MQFKLILIFLLFVGAGVYGIFSTDYVLGNNAVEWAIKYCSVPSILLAAFYSFYGTLEYHASNQKWKNILGLIFLSALCSIIFMASFHGYILTINKLGIKEEMIVEGEIIQINTMGNKSGNTSFSIDILTEAGDTLVLKTPHGKFHIGDTVKEPLLKGCLGILYR